VARRYKSGELIRRLRDAGAEGAFGSMTQARP